MRPAFLLLLTLLSIHSKAQENKTYKVNPGERVSQALLNNGLYQYPQFTSATVLYKNGTEGNGMLNYNRLIDEMQFIDAKGDTLSLDNENEISSINIGKDTFYYSQGFLQQIDHFSVRMAKKTSLELINRQKLGGFGEMNTAGVTTHTSVNTNQGVKDIMPKEVLTFEERKTYFIGDRFGRFKPLNKKNLYSFFSKKEKELSAYLNANPVNYIQEEDVLRLISFLKTL